MQCVVTDRYDARWREAEAELEGMGLGTVLAGFQRQARQVEQLWGLMAKKIAVSSKGAASMIGASAGRVINGAWRSLLEPFFAEHVMAVPPGDIKSLLA